MIETIEDRVITLSSAFDGGNTKNAVEGIAVGDEVMIDNSDYLAMQTLQRHQVPDQSYEVYDIYRDGKGEPKYPQLPFLLAPQIARGGGGCLQTGQIHGKMIAVCSILDESAFAWHGDWYRKAIQKACGGDENESFRLYYNDNCIHDDRAGHLDDPQHQVDYLGILHQALLDVAAWCEHGIEPPKTTNYKVTEGQVELPENATERLGLQPTVKAYVNGRDCVTVKAGDTVRFTAEIEMPPQAGTVIWAAFDFERTNDFSNRLALKPEADGTRAAVEALHVFEKPSVYFPVIKAAGSRTGTEEDIFVQCKNLARVRVIVE